MRTTVRYKKIDNLYKHLEKLYETNKQYINYKKPYKDYGCISVNFDGGFVTDAYFSCFNPAYIKCCVNCINGVVKVSYRQFRF